MHGHKHIIPARNDSPFVIDDSVWEKMPDHRDGMARESQLPPHGQGHCPAKKKEECCGPKKLESDYLVIRIPEIMHDARLPMTLVILMTATVCIHTWDALLRE